ncbi:hypothetical protein OC834_005506 [Tilletia horrida]|nr:hypothetical protein OC834_005506 [Tilletia horrida]
MSAGFADLTTATSRTIEASTRGLKTVKQLQADLTVGLEQLGQSLHQEMEQAQQRVADEMQRAQAHVYRNILGNVTKLVDQVAAVKTNDLQDVDQAAEELLGCTERLRQDVLQSEAQFMDSLAHMARGARTNGSSAK